MYCAVYEFVFLLLLVSVAVAIALGAIYVGGRLHIGGRVPMGLGGRLFCKPEVRPGPNDDQKCHQDVVRCTRCATYEETKVRESRQKDGRENCRRRRAHPERVHGGSPGREEVDTVEVGIRCTSDGAWELCVTSTTCDCSE